MKKLAIAALAIFALSFGSCKKDYVCKCKKTHVSGGTEVITDDGSLTFNDTRTRAQQRCNDEEGTGTDLAGDYTRNCEIQ